MDEVISLSSDDSDIEIVGSYNGFISKPDPLPLSAVRVDVDAVNVNVPPVRKRNTVAVETALSMLKMLRI